MMKSFTEVFTKDSNVNAWAKYNLGNYIELLDISMVAS